MSESEQIQQLRLEFLTKTQQLVDDCVYYRNLAITLGAKPEQMTDEYDRKLCATGLVDKREFAEVIQEKERFWKNWYEQEDKIRELEQANKSLIQDNVEWNEAYSLLHSERNVVAGVAEGLKSDVKSLLELKSQAIAEKKYLRNGKMPTLRLTIDISDEKEGTDV
jgi:hypothetical protein